MRKGSLSLSLISRLIAPYKCIFQTGAKYLTLESGSRHHRLNLEFGEPTAGYAAT